MDNEIKDIDWVIAEDRKIGIRNLALLTIEQKNARRFIIEDYNKIPDYESYDFICNCYMLGFKSKYSDSVLWIGIELNGYTHS